MEVAHTTCDGWMDGWISGWNEGKQIMKESHNSYLNLVKAVPV